MASKQSAKDLLAKTPFADVRVTKTQGKDFAFKLSRFFEDNSLEKLRVERDYFNNSSFEFHLFEDQEGLCAMIVLLPDGPDMNIYRVVIRKDIHEADYFKLLYTYATKYIEENYKEDYYNIKITISPLLVHEDPLFSEVLQEFIEDLGYKRGDREFLIQYFKKLRKIPSRVVEKEKKATEKAIATEVKTEKKKAEKAKKTDRPRKKKQKPKPTPPEEPPEPEEPPKPEAPPKPEEPEEQNPESEPTPPEDIELQKEPLKDVEFPPMTKDKALDLMNTILTMLLHIVDSPDSGGKTLKDVMNKTGLPRANIYASFESICKNAFIPIDELFLEKFDTAEKLLTEIEEDKREEGEESTWILFKHYMGLGFMDLFIPTDKKSIEIEILPAKGIEAQAESGYRKGEHGYRKKNDATFHVFKKLTFLMGLKAIEIAEEYGISREKIKILEHPYKNIEDLVAVDVLKYQLGIPVDVE